MFAAAPFSRTLVGLFIGGVGRGCLLGFLGMCIAQAAPLTTAPGLAPRFETIAPAKNQPYAYVDQAIDSLTQQTPPVRILHAQRLANFTLPREHAYSLLVHTDPASPSRVRISGQLTAPPQTWFFTFDCAYDDWPTSMKQVEQAMQLQLEKTAPPRLLP